MITHVVNGLSHGRFEVMVLFDGLSVNAVTLYQYLNKLELEYDYTRTTFCHFYE